MASHFEGEIADSLTLRFTGKNEDGSNLHELKAAHVAEVLQGLVELTRDFEKAGVLGADGPLGSEILVRPAKEGSFVIEIVRIVQENWEPMVAVGTAVGIPSISNVIWWATKSMRADVKDFVELDNGNMKVTWQDDTATEVPMPAWKELNKNKRRRKKQLHKILAPMNDLRVEELDLGAHELTTDMPEDQPKQMVLTRADYFAVAPTDEIEEKENIFETEAQMSAINFDDPTKWRVSANGQTRNATVEDEEFLRRVESGLAIRKTDIFRLRMREDTVIKNGHRSTTWTVLGVNDHRRASDDDGAQADVP